MVNLDFQCRTVSPLFLYGAGSTALELRPPSFKGMLRFWWRAAQAEDNIADLRRREGEIFGGTGKGEGKSSFSLRIRSGPVNGENRALLPHHDDPCCPNTRQPRPKAIVNHSFHLILSYRSLPREFAPEKLRALVELSSLLGGLGKRSRRGFGCFQIVAFNGGAFGLETLTDRDSLQKAILERLNFLSGDKYEVSREIICLRKECAGNYPYIQEIRLGESTKNVDAYLTRVGCSSHRHDCDFTGMGGSSGRLASPEYVSLVQAGGIIWPVITSLNPVFDPKRKQTAIKSKDYRGDFRAEILRGAVET
ncbi:hypothetical protein CEB3_c25100 [Peptococcaceae bacterium CEB3]|nr:hypothetical protein CEB3_c25100 [Peptococcaceae bacterium CEB3]